MATSYPTEDGSEPKESELRRLLDSFEPSSYEECETWGASEWFAAIQIRYLLGLAPLYGDDSPSSQEFVSITLDNIRHRPTSLAGVDRTLDPIEPAVRDMKVGELLGDFITHYAPDLSGQALEFDYVETDKKSNTLYAVCLAENRYLGDWLPLLVDLTKTDESIQKDFGNWLSEKRAESDDAARLKSQPPLSEATFRSWCTNRVLGYIDLELMTDDVGWILTDAEMGDALFPEDSNVDVVARIRRTVRPLADAIVTKRNLNALEAAAVNRSL